MTLTVEAYVRRNSDGGSVCVRVVGAAENSLHVNVQGNGAVAAVLLHGITMSHRAWAWLVPSLVDAGATVYGVDQRGHGESDRVPGGYHLTGYVADAVAVVERIAEKHGPVLLFGHSLGGVVAAAVTQQRPELVARCLLEDPGLVLADPDAEPPSPLLMEFFRVLRQSIPAVQEAGLSVDDLALRMAQVPTPFGVTAGERYHADAMQAWAHAHLRLDVTVLDPILANESAPDDPDQFDIDAGLHVPTVVLAADLPSGNRVTTVEDEQRLLASSPALRWIRPAGAGHSLHDEFGHRDTCRSTVLELLAAAAD